MDLTERSNFDYEEDKIKEVLDIDTHKVIVAKTILKDISSDIESNKYDDISDATSMTSSISMTSRKRNIEAPIIPEKKENNYIVDAKKLYQDFVKAVLKVKFEKIHSSHKGQDIPEKILFKECIKKNIPELEWNDFILNELKNPQKYSEYFKLNNKKLKVQKKEV